MGGTFSVAKTLIIPALISLLIYLILTYILLPLWTRYRTRYSYVPLPLGAPTLDIISSRTLGIRAWIRTLADRYLVPSAWRPRTDVVSAGDDDDEEGLDFGEDGHGEELGRVLGREARGGGDDVRRLSRDLEEGFMDDSDEEEIPARSR